MGYPVQTAPDLVQYVTELANLLSGTVQTVTFPLAAQFVSVEFVQSGSAPTAKLARFVFDAYNDVDAAAKLAQIGARDICMLGNCEQRVFPASSAPTSISLVSDAGSEAGGTTAIIRWGSAS